MDILAHGLWAGIGVAVAARHWNIPRRTALATVGLAMAPDLLQLLPLIVLGRVDHGHWASLVAYSSALPGMEPNLPPRVTLLVHHLHCIPHSAVIAAMVTLIALAITRTLWLPLWGWWSHIVIDVFTHSADFYPVPVFYPFTPWGFDGLAWNTPWFLLANYAVIVLMVGGLLWRRRLERH
jgi:LexA-binding, inner membrane-associated putative hydrolase